MRGAFVLLLAASPLLAADPSIQGERQVPPYKLVRLTLKDAPPKAGILWRVRGAGAVDIAGPRNKPDFTFVAPPGTYTVEAAFGSVVSGGLVLDAVEVTVTIGTAPVPPVPPDPPTPAPGKLGLVKLSRDGLARVDPSYAKTQTADLAAKQRSLAGIIRAGGLTQPADILATWRVENNKAATKDAWQPWAIAVSGGLEAAYTAGKLPKPTDWANAFDEIATGLETK